MNKDIFPPSNILDRATKEQLLNQKGIVIWLTGLSGSGKTTIGIALEKELNKRGKLTQLLDGDVVRSGINNNLGFSNEDRKENIRRIAEVAKLFLNCGVVTICCFVSPTEEIRSIARNIISSRDFVEVFVNTSLEICEQRDTKGLYAKARKGELKYFTGINAPFETPTNFSIELKTDEMSVEDCAKTILNKLKITI
jgi:adenylylsulfate kinase